MEYELRLRWGEEKPTPEEVQAPHEDSIYLNEDYVLSAVHKIPKSFFQWLKNSGYQDVGEIKLEDVEDEISKESSSAEAMHDILNQKMQLGRGQYEIIRRTR